MSLALANVQTAIDELRTIFGERLSTSTGVRDHHGKDESWHHPHRPDAVVFPNTTEEVAEVVRICARHRTPVVAYGTGTSLEGNVIPHEGGVVVDLMNLNQVLKVNVEDLDVTVQARVTRKQLNEYVRDQGLFFPIDPGADASLGGMAATRASGTNAVRYGTMRENVLALTVVLSDGRIIRTSRRARKSAAGYDLTRLFVGSEGTLGIITEVTLKLYGIPEAMAAAVCSFDNLEGAVDTVIQVIQLGIPVARIELLDDVQMDSLNKFSKLSYPVKDTLFVEFHGTQAGVKEQAELVQSIAAEHGGGEFKWATKQEERTQLWAARHDVTYANKALRPGSEIWATDVCVPISRLAECILETKKDLKQSFLIAPLVGHVGDGNFHLGFLINREDPKELAEAERLNERLVMRALAMDGTCTGEHGIGLGKQKFLIAEHGDAVAVMLEIKKALDPLNIMNPGKIFSL
ncbi:MAG TPA: FAD-linked oxidase C-terminal domain-containing protein [Burkholderiales bacterium]|nr:FAD-linked oxidase C-terminal domain-containing protein [Burkholderiales bacterium]